MPEINRKQKTTFDRNWRFSSMQMIIFLLPLIAIPVIPFGFETPKVFLFEFLVIALFFFSVFHERFTLVKPLWLGIGGVLLLALVTLLFFPSETVWFNNPVRLQGLFLQLVFLLWVVLVSVKKDSNLPKLLLLVCFALISLSGLFMQDPVTYRALGTLGEANSYAGISILLGILTLFSWKGHKRFVFIASLVFILMTLAVFISSSRSALLALSLSTILLILAKRRISPVLLTMVGVVFLLSTLILPFLSRTNSWEDRSMIWQTAVIAGSQSPLIGHGFGNITPALKEAAVILENHIRFQFVDSSHNIFLDWWVQGGILGVVVLVYFLCFSMYRYIKRKMVLELIILFACLQLLLFNPVSITILAVFWWCVGRGFTVYRD